MSKLIVTSPAFEEGGFIPKENTGRGPDRSPALHIDGIDPKAVSLAVTLHDASHPLIHNYSHWILWNIPVLSDLPADIPPGETVGALNGAVQGLAYGKHRYKGPKPPFHWLHTYPFTVYVLDCMLTLPPQSKRRDLFRAMEGHILQKATLSGKFQSGRKED